MVDKVKENFVRRQAARLGLALHKSKGQKWRVDNQMGYRIVDPNHNTIVQGERFDLDLQQVENFLSEEEKRLTA